MRKLVLPVIGFYNRDSDFAAAQGTEIPKRGIDVRVGSKADIVGGLRDVRFTSKADIPGDD